MTQDQYGQARGPGYVVRGDVVRGDVSDDDTQEFPSEQERPVTRFQKVASTLRGSGPEWNEPATPAGDRDEAVAVTSPVAADHQATEPDVFGTVTHAGNGATVPPAAEGQVGAAAAPAAPAAPRNLIPDAAQYTAQWHRIQYKFVDDPRASVTEAADVVAQVTAKIEAAIQERQRSLRGRWAEGSNADTEALRETLLMYKSFLDQLIGPGRAS